MNIAMGLVELGKLKLKKSSILIDNKRIGATNHSNSKSRLNYFVQSAIVRSTNTHILIYILQLIFLPYYFPKTSNKYKCRQIGIQSSYFTLVKLVKLIATNSTILLTTRPNHKTVNITLQLSPLYFPPFVFMHVSKHLLNL